MKCEPNQLVRYVGKNPLNQPNIYGWIGTTVEKYIDSKGTLCWKVSPPISNGDIFSKGEWFLADVVVESSLQPIENPGEDAVDQMVLRVGKPKTEDKILTV